MSLVIVIFSIEQEALAYMTAPLTLRYLRIMDKR